MDNPVNKEVFLKAVQISKSYKQGTSELSILKSIDLDIYEGDAIGIVGSSGAGKSTLLHILGTLDRPDLGQVWCEGQNLFTMSDDEISHFRNQKMGFVFQFHHLLSELSALENIMLPGRIAGADLNETKKRALALLEMMDLADRAHHYPNELSGGELQRMAIARSLLRHPKILFADEPTGNLDSTNSQKIQDLFFTLQRELGLILVVVTHDQNFAQKFPRLLKMKDGTIVG